MPYFFNSHRLLSAAVQKICRLYFRRLSDRNPPEKCCQRTELWKIRKGISKKQRLYRQQLFFQSIQKTFRCFSHRIPAKSQSKKYQSIAKISENLPERLFFVFLCSNKLLLSACFSTVKMRFFYIF